MGAAILNMTLAQLKKQSNLSTIGGNNMEFTLDVHAAIAWLEDDFGEVAYSHYNGESHYFTAKDLDNDEDVDIEMEPVEDKVHVSYRHPNGPNTWIVYQILVND
jgi:hypothetical protein